MDDKVIDQLYKIHGSPYFWREKAEEMKFIAETLEPTVMNHANQLSEIIKSGKNEDRLNLHPNVFYAVLAHMGFSIECLCKGVIIQNNPSFISNGTMAKHLRTHNLRKLVKLTNVSITSQDLEICKLMTEKIEKYRYPIPLKAPESDDKNYFTVPTNYSEKYNNLYKKLYPLSSKFGIHDMDK